jgi:ORF6N domain
MSKKKKSNEQIVRLIVVVRGQRVILDFDIAALYGVRTKALVQAVKRNAGRFPRDFMFRLTKRDITNLRSQIVTSSWGGRRTVPYAFTEQGVAMLSSVLRSRRAMRVNVEIMRAFVQLRHVLSGHTELVRKIDALEERYDEQFRVVFKAIRRLIGPESQRPKRRIGYLSQEGLRPRLTNGCEPSPAR